MCFCVPRLCSKIPKINNWTGEFALSFGAYTVSQSRSVVTSTENPAPDNSPGWSVSQILATNVLMDTTTNQVISRSLVCVWVTGIAFPPNWTTLPHGQHMYTWSPASWKSGQPSTTRLCHTLDNHPDNHPLAGQKHIKLPALTSVGILGNDYYWIDGKGTPQWARGQFTRTLLYQTGSKNGVI